MNLISRKQGIMAENKNLTPSIIKELEKKTKAIEIRVAILRGKTKKDNRNKFMVYQELYYREFYRLYSKLIEIKFDNENLDQLIKGYIQYLIQNRDNFDYLELRKYRKGILKTITQCAIKYGLTDREIKNCIGGDVTSSNNYYDVEEYIDDEENVDDFGEYASSL